MVAAVAAASTSDRGGGFGSLGSLAALVESYGKKHGIERVEVVPDEFGAQERLIVYFIADGSSVKCLRIVVPFGKHRFVSCELLRDGQMEFGNGMAY
jgi:hypothetical protein